MSRNIAMLLVLIFLTASCVTVAKPVFSSTLTTQEIALAFIEKALPVDLSKYTVNLTKYTDMNQTADIVQYTLESEESVLVVNCYVQNDILTGCNLELKSGSVITDQPYANITDAAIGFLEKYQTYTERDSTEMINILSSVDTTKNSTVTAGSLKLTVTKQDAFGADMTTLSWTYAVDGVDYTSLKVGFRDGIFNGLNDNRGIYTIGDASVKFSKEQAIDIAMEYIGTYSYLMPDGTRISGFNVTEDKTVAELHSAVRDSSVLYPSWRVTLHLNQTYPGSVDALVVSIWADSGEVFVIGHEGPGGGLPVANSAEGENSAQPEPFPTALIITASGASAAVIGIGLLFYFRKRKKL